MIGPPEAVTLQDQSLALKRRGLPANQPFFAYYALDHMAQLCEKTGSKAEAAKLRAGLEALKGGK